MLALLTILFLALLILGHEFGHFIAAKISKVRVDEFGVGFPPRLFSKKLGETRYSLNLLPFGGFVRIRGETGPDTKEKGSDKRNFYSQPFSKKIFIIAAGVLINILIAWVAFSIVLGVGLPSGVIVESVAENSPAELAGIRAGDIIEGFDSVDVFVEYLEANRGKAVVINDKSITPRVDVPEGEGPLGVVIAPSGIEPTPFPLNIWRGLVATLKTLGLIFAFLGSFIFGALSGNFEALSQVSGPVGVFNIVYGATQMGFVYLIQLLGVISLNLAVLNIIPFPALDGGRILFISLQKVFGDKILNRKLETIVNVAGFLFLIALMIAVTIRDIMNL